jgi:hypothetical protein
MYMNILQMKPIPVAERYQARTVFGRLNTGIMGSNRTRGKDYVCFNRTHAYEGVPKCFRTGRLERELQTVQLSATRCSCIAILWVSLVSFAAITLCDASQGVFVVDFVNDSVQQRLDTPSYIISQ